MARYSLKTTCMIVLLAWAAFVPEVLAQKVPKIAPVAIAVVDVEGVMRSTTAARSIRKQIEAQRNVYKKEFTARESKLRDEEKALAQQRAILAQEVFKKRVREFKERVAQAQRDVQSRKRQLDQAFSQSLEKVRNALIKVVAQLAEESKVGLVLFKNQIVIAERSLDLSKEALKRVNKQLPDLKVALPPLDQ